MAHMASMNAIQIARADQFALSLEGAIDLLRGNGVTPHKMAEALNCMGLRTPKGHWAHKSVRNVCARLDAIRKQMGLLRRLWRLRKPIVAMPLRAAYVTEAAF